MAKFLTATVENGNIVQADILLSDAEIKDNPFANKEKEAAFYHMVLNLLDTTNNALSGASGTKVTTPNIDCTKINVSKTIQDSWYEYASNNGIDTTSLTMSLAFNGPKALDTIPDNQIQILSGCLDYTLSDNN